MKNIIRTVWTYKVNGEQYAREAYQALADRGADVQLVRMDHVASDFAKTGRNWDVVTTVVAGGTEEEPARSAGELAAHAASVAAQLNDPHAEAIRVTPYYCDAEYMLVELFCAAQRQGKLVKVNAAFHKLADSEPYRVHKLLISLKRGRQLDVMDALLAL